MASGPGCAHLWIANSGPKWSNTLVNWPKQPHPETHQNKAKKRFWCSFLVFLFRFSHGKNIHFGGCFKKTAALKRNNFCSKWCYSKHDASDREAIVDQLQATCIDVSCMGCEPSNCNLTCCWSVMGHQHQHPKLGDGRKLACIGENVLHWEKQQHQNSQRPINKR